MSVYLFVVLFDISPEDSSVDNDLRRVFLDIPSSSESLLSDVTVSPLSIVIDCHSTAE